jgi:hypothetical protein
MPRDVGEADPRLEQLPSLVDDVDQLVTSRRLASVSSSSHGSGSKPDRLSMMDMPAW